MSAIDLINVRRSWEECPKDSRIDARWGVLYATLNTECHFRLSRITHEALGSPDSYVLLYDRERDVIGREKDQRLSVVQGVWDRGRRDGEVSPLPDRQQRRADTRSERHLPGQKRQVSGTRTLLSAMSVKRENGACDRAPFFYLTSRPRGRDADRSVRVPLGGGF